MVCAKFPGNLTVTKPVTRWRRTLETLSRVFSILLNCSLCVNMAVGDHERRLCLAVSKGCDRFSDTVVIVQSGKLSITRLSLCISLSLLLSLSLSHSRSGGRVTAPIRSRKSQRRRGSVLNCPPGQISLHCCSMLV